MSSFISKSPTAPKTNSGKLSTTSHGVSKPKQRACDECRSRKLACTKELEGCARCKKESIKCQYSPQKQMGRPRKRQHIDISEDKEYTSSNDAVATALAADFCSFMDSTNSEDLDLFSFIGPFTSETVPELQPSQQTLVFPSLNETDLQQFSYWTAQSTLSESGSNYMLTMPGSSMGDDGLTSELGSLSFLFTNEKTTEPLSTSDSLTITETAASLTAATVAPSASKSETSPEAQPSSCNIHFVTESSPPCGCLAKLYLALDALQKFPREVGPAMGCARSAAKTAYAVTECPACSPPGIMHPTFRPSTQAYQNLLILGALLPSIANSYHKILAMVDSEVAKATAERHEIPFSLERYGGLWDRLGSSGCSTAAALEGQTLPPMMWKNTILALLKVDVYGYKFDCQTGGPSARALPRRQVGLKDIVDYLLERQRLRHAMMDELLASGKVSADHIHSNGYQTTIPGDKHNCERILEVARLSIEHLVIS